MIIKAIVRPIVAALLILQVTAACVRNPYEVNVSSIECDLSVRNLAGEIFETSPPDLSARAETLKEEYGKALTTYSTVIGLGDPTDEKWESAFILFATDLRNLALWDDVKRVWPDLASLEDGLEDAFRHYLYYFPEKAVPEVIACISVFNNSIIIDDSLLMISLDRYLGSDSKYYPALGIFDYQSRKMTPEYALSDCIYAWGATEWDHRVMNYGTKNLLNTMLHEAKLLYFTKRMIPEIPDTVLFGFTGRQLGFCRENEGPVWEYLISRDMLFSTDGFLIRKFTGEAPFTSYFSEDSPGRTVVWTGFRVIERYMRNNPSVTLADLMNMTDCQAILTGAKYNPE